LNYTGQRKDDTGLLYYHARYYDPSLARFVSPDSIVATTEGTLTVDVNQSVAQESRSGPVPTQPQLLNRYSYVANNPLTYGDPTGHCREKGGDSRPYPDCAQEAPDQMTYFIVSRDEARQMQTALDNWLGDLIVLSDLAAQKGGLSSSDEELQQLLEDLTGAANGLPGASSAAAALLLGMLGPIGSTVTVEMLAFGLWFVNQLRALARSEDESASISFWLDESCSCAHADWRGKTGPPYGFRATKKLSEVIFYRLKNGAIDYRRWPMSDYTRNVNNGYRDRIPN
jgi:RHS repeat-associated protein